MVDHSGEIVDGDHMLGICAQDMLERETLRRKTVVGTVMSNLGLELALKAKGIRLLRAPVGDRYVVEAMLKGGYNLGGEQSGHVVFLNYTTTGDGILTALRVLSVMLRKNKPLAELAAFLQKYPQILINVGVKEKTGPENPAPGPPGHPRGRETPGNQGPAAGALLRDRAQTARHDRRRGRVADRQVAQDLAQTLKTMLN